MQYMGGKKRLATELVKLFGLFSFDNYYEPFCGSGSLAQAMHSMKCEKFYSDKDTNIIALLVAVKNGWIPPSEVTEETYRLTKEHKSLVTPEFLAFVGYGCSFGGKWFGGYAKNRKERNYASFAKNTLLKQKKYLQNINFSVCSYDSIVFRENSLIYCDPPYAQTTKYKTEFCSDSFWQWCRNQSNLVLVSEYSAPKDFATIYEKSQTCNLSRQIKGVEKTEKVFIHRSQIYRLPF